MRLKDYDFTALLLFSLNPAAAVNFLPSVVIVVMVQFHKWVGVD